MTTTDKSTSVKIYIAFIIALTLVVIFSAYARYIFAKDYYFLIEATCDPNIENCQIRDCDDYCPPNELDIYKTYRMSAKYFDQCEDNSCSNICQVSTTSNLCELMLCDEDESECSGDPNN
jgi:hypothetical protein